MDTRQAEIINAFEKKYGKGKASKILSVLGQNQQFINALSTPVGQELLADLITMTETRLNTLANIDVNESKEKFIQAQCDYRSTLTLLNKWSNRLEQHSKYLTEVQGGN